MAFLQCPARSLPRFLSCAKPFFASSCPAPCQASMNPQPLTVVVEATPAAAAEGQEMVRPLPSTPSSSSSSSSSSASSSSSSSEEINDGTKPQKQGSPFPKKGQRLEMLCESLAFKGKGVCKTVESGFVVLCDRALPGERLIALITKKKGSFAEAIKIETLSPHHNAVVAPCEHAADCGGCKMQNLAYDAQLVVKEEQVFELISRLGRFGSDSGNFMKAIIGCKSPFHYRNKMEFSYGTKKWTPKDELGDARPSNEDGFALGLHAPGRFDKVLSINKCLLQQDSANKVLEIVQRYCSSHTQELPPYDTHTHKGFLKHLIIRSGREPETGALQLMVNFVTSTYEPALLQPLVNELVTAEHEVVSIVNNINSSIGNTAAGEEEHVLYGSSTITESINGLVFEISANSFFQTNPRQAEILYGLVEQAAGLEGNGEEIVLDLFCGTGTIGLTLAKRVKHVYGYEVVPEAVADARRNAARNDIANATFIEGNLNKIQKCFADQIPQPDVVIIDPNRPGMHPDLVKYLLKQKPRRIVYVSCNPATCARDLDYLAHGLPGADLDGAYRLLSVQPVDMFPHTPHIECVCALELKSPMENTVSSENLL